MTKNKFFLLLMAVFALGPVCVFAQTVAGTVIDLETGLTVPYAIIQNAAGSVTRNSIVEADVDGKFSIHVTTGATYTASRLGYKPVTFTAEQLLSDKVIKMEMLPYELNPVIVTSGTALQDIYRAFDANRKRFPAIPFFRRCYIKEEIVTSNDTLLNTKAIIDAKVVRIRATGHRTGIFRALSLKGLQISYNNIDSKDILPAGPLYLAIAYLSFSKKDEENLVFSRFRSENDSITIIAYHPKNYFSGDSEISWMTGQVIIDTKTWRILKIDMTLDNISREYQNYLAKTSSNGKKIVHEANQSIFFSANGLPSKVEEKVVYSLKNKPEDIYTWTCVLAYKDISKTEYRQKPSRSYKWEKFLFQQKPVTISDFDTQFNHGFQ